MATQTDAGRTAYLLSLMKAADDAFNARDMDAMDALHRPDVIAHVTGTETTTTRQPHREGVENVIRAFPNVHVVNDPYPIQFGSNGWVSVVSRQTGTFTGELRGPDGELIPPTGKSFDLTFCTTSHWGEDDRMIEEFVFWDSTLFAQQIGLI